MNYRYLECVSRVRRIGAVTVYHPTVDMTTLLNYCHRLNGSTIAVLRLNTPRTLSTSAVVYAKKQKRKADPAGSTEKAILGRPSNNLKMGVVGMPNIGYFFLLTKPSTRMYLKKKFFHSKSSLFNALTSSSVPAENYPFCTIDPSEARVLVPDSRFDWLCDTYKPKKQTPAHVRSYIWSNAMKQ